MNFYYDPILGLQYNYIELVILDIVDIPISMSIQEFIKDWEYWSKKIGIQPLEKYPRAQIIGQITEYKL